MDAAVHDISKRLKQHSRSGLDHKIETYPAKHGWVFRDTSLYDSAASKRHSQTLLALLHTKLSN